MRIAAGLWAVVVAIMLAQVLATIVARAAHRLWNKLAPVVSDEEVRTLIGLGR